MGHTVTPPGDLHSLERWITTIDETCSTGGDIRSYVLGAAGVILDGEHSSNAEKLTTIRVLLRAADIVAAEMGVKL